MTLTAYQDPDDQSLAIHSEPPSRGWFTCEECDAERPMTAMIHGEIITDEHGNRVFVESYTCNECVHGNATLTSGPTLETYVLEWLSLAEGKRIVWKTEDHGRTPTSWSGHFYDIAPGMGPTKTLFVSPSSLPHYAYAIVSDDVEDFFHMPAGLAWSYFEDWLQNTHGIPLVSLRDGYQSAA
ncbi:hypothetical protein [Nocardia sp. MW-W600-9]